MAVSFGPSIEYDTGSSNAVAMDNYGHVVEVHASSGLLYYRVGAADFISRTITWGPSLEYDTGSSNAVAMDNHGHVVEGHASSDRVYYRVGAADFTSQTIAWGASIEYDAGTSTAVALAKGDPNVIVEGQLVAVHASGTGHLYYHLGTADFTSQTIALGPGV